MNLTLNLVREKWFSRLSGLFRHEKIRCFHCGETMRKEGAIFAQFQERDQPVCCHGCLAVLNIIVQNNFVTEYLVEKSKIEMQPRP